MFYKIFFKNVLTLHFLFDILMWLCEKKATRFDKFKKNAKKVKKHIDFKC